MKIKSERDFWSGLMFVAVGVGFAIGATNYSMGPACPPNDPCAANLWARMSQLSAHPGAGYFPLGLAILLAILGSFVLFKSLTIESEGGDPVGAFAWRPLIIIVAAITIFGLMLEPLGLALTVPVLIIITSLAGDEFHWKGVLISAIILTLFSWLIFVYGLKLTIPVWPALPRLAAGAPDRTTHYQSGPAWISSTTSASASASPSPSRTCSTGSSAACSAR